MTENRPDPSATRVIVIVCVAVVSSTPPVAVDDCDELAACVIGVSVSGKVVFGIDRVEDAKQPSP